MISFIYMCLVISIISGSILVQYIQNKKKKDIINRQEEFESRKDMNKEIKGFIALLIGCLGYHYLSQYFHWGWPISVVSLIIGIILAGVFSGAYKEESEKRGQKEKSDNQGQ